MLFEEVIRCRMATRKFEDTFVEREKVEKILEAGRLAPTAKNMQPQKVFVIASENGLLKVDKASPCRYHAPLVLMVCSDKSVAFQKDGHSTYEMDAVIVATHMMLEATNLGVDNVWVEMFDRNILKKEFNLKDPLEPICLLMLGYRASDCPVNPMHEVRNPISEMVEYV